MATTPPVIRDRIITFRATDSEVAILRTAAELQGLSVSDLIRRALIESQSAVVTLRA